MLRQCERVGASLETLSPREAERMIPAVERVLEVYLARPADMKQIVHELRLEIGAERFKRGELSPERVEGSGVPSAKRGVDQDLTEEARREADREAQR